MGTPLHAAGQVVAAALLVLCGCSDAPGTTSTSGAGGSQTSSTTTGGAGGGTGGASSTTTGVAGGATGGSSGASTGATGGTGGAGGAGGSSSVPIINPGFETDAVAAGSFNDQGAPTGWAKYDPGDIIGKEYNSLGVVNPTGTDLYVDGAPEGSNVALVFLWRELTSGTPAGISQQLSHALLASTHYALRVKVGNIAPNGPAPYDLTGFPGYRVELLAGDTVLAADENTLAPADGTFAQSTVAFTSGASGALLGQPVGIRLINLNAPGPGIEVNFDDVELEATPSP